MEVERQAAHDEQVNDLRILTKLYYGYAGMWQLERPALAKAVDRAIRYLAGEATIEQYHYDKLNKAMGARLKKFRNPRFVKGDLSQTYLPSSGKVVCFCTSDAYISENGKIVNDWMVAGLGIHTYDHEQLPKQLKQ